MATEAVHQSLGSVPVSTVQLALTERHCSVDVQVRLRYAITEESRSGSGRCQVVSTDFQLVCHLEAAGMTGQQAASEVPQGQNDAFPDL